MRPNPPRTDFRLAQSSKILRSLAACLGLVFLLAACSGLGGEPRIVATQLPPTPLPQDLGYPAEAPDLASGAQLFAANCTDCHGTDGAGNGKLVASGQVAAPPDFTNPDTAAHQTPAEYFEIITNGRIENLMPPWRDALTENERWAVTLYAYTLAYSADDLVQGKAIYEDDCAECQQPDSENQLDLSDPMTMSGISDEVLSNLITDDANDPIPAFGADLSEAERLAVVRYLRSLSLANTHVIGTAAPESTLEAAPLPDHMTVTGQIGNATANSATPGNLPVTLYRLEETAEGIRDDSFTTTADAEGRFTVEAVPLDLNSSYIVSTVYRERLFTGEILTAQALATGDTLTLNVYEPTQDPSVVTITSVTTTVDAVGDGLQVLQEFIFENHSDRVYTNDLQVGEGAFASVVVGLPPGAAGLAFAGASNRFVLSEEQQVVVDTIPVWPERPHTIQLSYFIPYDSNGAVIEQPVYFALNGPVRLLMWPPTLTVASAQLTLAGEQFMQSQSYTGYEGDLTLAAGETIRYDLSGEPQATATPQVTPISSNSTLLLVGGLLIEIALIVGVLYWYFRRRSRQQMASPDRNNRIEHLIRQIAELDDAHDRGELDAAHYEKQRAQLKARLAAMMNDEPQK